MKKLLVVAGTIMLGFSTLTAKTFTNDNSFESIVTIQSKDDEKALKSRKKALHKKEKALKLRKKNLKQDIKLDKKERKLKKKGIKLQRAEMKADE